MPAMLCLLTHGDVVNLKYCRPRIDRVGGALLTATALSASAMSTGLAESRNTAPAQTEGTSKCL
jgi:hypothetical protein